MTRVTWLILGLWAVALAAFFVIARPAPAPAITYRADPTIAAWVDAAAAAEARASRVELKPAGGGGEPNATLGRLNQGAPVAETRLIVAAWQGTPAEQVDSPELLTSWRNAVRDGRVRFAVPGQNSPLGKDFLTLIRGLEGAAEADFYRGVDRLRDRDELYIEDVRNQGPARWDAGILYEDAALQINRQRSEQNSSQLLRLFYLDSARPVRYLFDSDGPGDRLLAALASPAGQSLALEYGIRPLDPNAESANSLFDRFAAQGAQPPR